MVTLLAVPSSEAGPVPTRTKLVAVIVPVASWLDPKFVWRVMVSSALATAVPSMTNASAELKRIEPVVSETVTPELMVMSSFPPDAAVV